MPVRKIPKEVGKTLTVLGTGVMGAGLLSLNPLALGIGAGVGGAGLLISRKKKKK